MKKLVCVVLLITSLLFALPASAKVVGSVLTTDIVAYIDYLPVPAYNIDGYTAVIVRDLEKYGYTVEWYEDTRTVKFYRDFSRPVEGIIPTWEPSDVGTKLFDVHSTDIRVFFGDKEIEAYNLGGRTAVKLRDINTVSAVEFDAERKIAHLSTYEVELFEDEKEYMRDHFAKNMFLISELEYHQQQLYNKIEAGTYKKSDLTAFSDAQSEITASFEAFKTYKEPYGFDKSAMEIWWAMVNTNIASECLVKMANEGMSAENVKEYITARADSTLQRQRALTQLYDDMMSLAFMWN